MKKILKFVLVLAVAGAIIGGGIAYYMFNMPHRDVQSTPTDYKLSVSEIVEEYLRNPEEADRKYLKEDGLSRILEITGIIARTNENMAGQFQVELSEEGSPARVRCTMLPDALGRAQRGDLVILKGVIRSGSYFDEDFNRFEPVIMDQCAVVD
jgi:hypothetical protein